MMNNLRLYVVGLFSALLPMVVPVWSDTALALELVRSNDLADWEVIPITNEMLEAGRIVLDESGEAGFFQLRIRQAAPDPAPEGMVLVEGGTLSTTNALDGTVVSPFYIGKHEVTWWEWQEVRDWAAANVYDIGNVGAGCADNHPVYLVNWYDVVKWCNAKSERDGRTPVYTVNGAVYRSGETVPTPNSSANGYRLPLEAEWEFAARGGNQTNGYTYAGSDDLNAVGWYQENSGGPECTLSVSGLGNFPVGEKAANELGLYDMSGNMWEWCWDASNGTSAGRVRGGSWIGGADQCAVSFRYSYSPGSGSSSRGFRYGCKVSDGEPTIGSISDQTIVANTSTGLISFTVGHSEADPASLTLSGVSSDPTLIPHQNIFFGGIGADRTINVYPQADETGIATITVTVSDGNRTASSSFVVTVTN